MTYEELMIINFGTPSIELLNKFIREQEGITIFYKHQLDKDKRSYWKGKMGEAAKKKIGAIELGKKIYGNRFHENILFKHIFKHYLRKKKRGITYGPTVSCFNQRAADT